MKEGNEDNEGYKNVGKDGEGGEEDLVGYLFQYLIIHCQAYF